MIALNTNLISIQEVVEQRERILDFQVVEQSEDRLSKFGMAWDTVLEVTVIHDRDRFLSCRFSIYDIRYTIYDIRYTNMVGRRSRFI